MPTPSRKTPHRIRQTLKMHKAGSSSREIAEEIGVHHVTVSKWLRDAGIKANGGQGARKTRTRIQPEGVAAVLADAAAEVVDLKDAGVPPTDRAGAVAHLGRRLMQISALADELGRNDGRMTQPAQLAAAIRIERELSAQIVALSPQEEPDPENDPTNIEAAAAVRREIASLVEVAERNVRCVHCGKSPYPPVAGAEVTR